VVVPQNNALDVFHAKVTYFDHSTVENLVQLAQLREVLVIDLSSLKKFLATFIVSYIHATI
jgi:hypothetical protein